MANAKIVTGKDAKSIPKAKRGRKGLRCRNLSNEQRASLLQSLLKHRTSENKIKNKDKDNANNNSTTKLRKGALLEASRSFGVSTKTCKRIWERFLETSDASGSGGDVSHRKHQSGRPKKISSEELRNKINKLPPETRASVRGIARALGIPHTTIHRRLKSGEIKPEIPMFSKNTIRPLSNNNNVPPQSPSEENEKDEIALGSEKETTKSTNAPQSKTKTKPKSSNGVVDIMQENGKGSNKPKSKTNAKAKTKTSKEALVRSGSRSVNNNGKTTKP